MNATRILGGIANALRGRSTASQAHKPAAPSAAAAVKDGGSPAAAPDRVTADEKADGFFVYGTLKTGKSNHGVIKPFVATVDNATLQGAALYDWGPYPAMTLETKAPGTVHGEFITVTDFERALPRLDALEGYRPGAQHNLYDRRVVPVTLANGDRKRAYVYVMTETKASARGPRVESGDWQGRGW